MLLYGFSSPIGGFGGVRGNYRGLNLIPFRSITSYLTGRIIFPYLINNLLGNIVVFVPMGIYISLLRKSKGVFISLLYVFFVSLSFEVLQYIFARGTCDIDDVLLNCLGGLIGIIVYKCLRFFLKKEERVRSAITVLAAIIGIPVFVYLMIDIMRK